MHIEATCCRVGPEGGRTLLFVRVSADLDVRAETRPPAHLAIALDVSSSMGGPPLAAALDAIRRLGEGLGPEDRLGIVTFDREPQVIFRPRAMTAEARVDLGHALARVRPGLGTHLHGGYLATGELLASAFVPGARPRVLLLTDGFASSGPGGAERFVGTARELLARGITTSTIGFGPGFDEELLRSLARAGEGSYHFVAGPADMAEVFAAELQSAQAVEATGVTLKLHPSPGVTSLELLHRYATRADADGLVVEVGSVGRSGPRRVLLELGGPLTPGREAARLRASWTPVDGGALGGQLLPVLLEESPDPLLLRDLHAEEIQLDLARSESSIWERLARGDRASASAHLEDARTHVSRLERGALLDAEELRIHRSRLDDAADVIAGRLEEEAARRRARAMIDAVTHSRIRRE